MTPFQHFMAGALAGSWGVLFANQFLKRTGRAAWFIGMLIGSLISVLVFP